MRGKLFLILRDMGFKAFTLADKADYLLANDVVPVVRCKNCKNKGNEDFCPLLSMAQYTEDDDFCSYGERRAE